MEEPFSCLEIRCVVPPNVGKLALRGIRLVGGSLLLVSRNPRKGKSSLLPSYLSLFYAGWRKGEGVLSFEMSEVEESLDIIR